MNDQRLKQLFGAAKKEKSATPAEGFEQLVMRQIQCNPARRELTIPDVLGLWFPRLALAAVTVIAVCVVSQFVSTAPSLTDSAAQLSIQELAEN